MKYNNGKKRTALRFMKIRQDKEKKFFTADDPNLVIVICKDDATAPDDLKKTTG